MAFCVEITLLLLLTSHQSQSGVLAASGPNGIGFQHSSPVKAGFRTAFSCSSRCVPPCVFSWSVEGLLVNGSTVSWLPDGLDRTLALTCTALNPETADAFTRTLTVKVINTVSVQIRPENQLPSLNRSLGLLCQGAAPGLPVEWYRNGVGMAAPRDGLSLAEYNTTLHFDALLPSDGGFYRCKATMPSLDMGTAFSVGYLLNFDPWNVTLSGPDVVLRGVPSTFSCLASCTRDVDCTIQFKSGFPTGTYFSTYENILEWTPSSIPGSFQNLTCVAENTAARRSVGATKMVEVKGFRSSGTETVPLGTMLGPLLILGLMPMLFDS